MLRNVQRLLVLPAAFLANLTAASLHGQTPIIDEPGYTPTLTFDVTVIRQAPPPDGNFKVSVTSLPHSSRFEATNLPLKALLQIAYGFDAPLVGEPDWMGNTFYNIQCRSDADADAKLAKLTDNEVRLEKRHAIRAMLEDRLGLKTHMESRNSSIYNLVVAKGGVKMTPSPVPPPPADGSPAGPPPPANVDAHPGRHGLEFVGTNSPIIALTGALSSMMEAPVVDKTGLHGIYNYDLQFGREWSANDPDGWPSILTAVQEQLGLKLEATHETIPNLVIDSIHKPNEN